MRFYTRFNTVKTINLLYNIYRINLFLLQSVYFLIIF
jgi:hypothetical protein